MKSLVDGIKVNTVRNNKMSLQLESHSRYLHDPVVVTSRQHTTNEGAHLRDRHLLCDAKNNRAPTARTVHKKHDTMEEIDTVCEVML